MDAYRIVKIPKGGGRFRVLHIPNPELKERQKRILKMLKSFRILPGPWVHAYMKRRSVKTAAERLFVEGANGMRSPTCLLKMDIRNFFPSVRPHHVEQALRAEGLPEGIVDRVVDQCFVKYEGVTQLPQGAPTSPLLAALVMKRITIRLSGLVKKWNGCEPFPATFTTYADNLAFASDDPSIQKLIHPIRNILRNIGFELNPEKTEFHRKPAPLVVCGVQINDKVGCKRDYWRKLRAALGRALIDQKAGLVPADFYLEEDARKEIKTIAGIEKKSGIVARDKLPKRARNFLRKNIDEIKQPIPWETWRGQVSFVKSLDPKKGESLEGMLRELEELCQRNGRSSPSPKTASSSS